MSLLARLFRQSPDPREALRPLWHRIVAVSREEHWYRQGRVADSLAGRFDMITVILALVLLRMEREHETASRTALLTELFVEDMDGQLRESGVGDLVVGKHIGRLVAVLGGRLGALRDALDGNDAQALQAALSRNVTLLDGATPDVLAADVRSLYDRIGALPAADLLAGKLPQ